MSATFVTSTWPLAPRSPRVFGRRLAADSAHGNRPSLQWVLRRNCSLTPRQLGTAYLLLCSVSLLVAAVFFWQGAPYIAAFAGLELLAVGLAMLLFARHAGDRETLTLVGATLFVEQSVGPRLKQCQLQTDWIRVEPVAGQGSLVQISGGGRTVQVGRHVRPEWRAALAHEIRLALRQPPGSSELQNDLN
jgi:uncharacterized membrane protein